MAIYDIFNGDADGICALLQLQLDNPRESILITGVKRDIKLLAQVEPCEGDIINVLDVALEKNREALDNCLQAGVLINYFDHHNPGTIPTHKNLNTYINTDANTCTSLIVNEHLSGRFAAWAVTGAFGDNMVQSALAIAAKIPLSDEEVQMLKRLGTYINYNGYGPNESVLHFPPTNLFKLLRQFENPLDFIQQNKAVFDKLENGYNNDLEAANTLKPYISCESSTVYMLPDQPWAKRVSGVFGNQLASDNPGKAHAIITELQDNGYLVSVRAPLNNKKGADQICLQFNTGGGRKGAAGINQLPADQLDTFISIFQNTYK